jgi:hypothetical protein
MTISALPFKGRNLHSKSEIRFQQLIWQKSNHPQFKLRMVDWRWRPQLDSMDAVGRISEGSVGLGDMPARLVG